jgi:hypothetical protein
LNGEIRRAPGRHQMLVPRRLGKMWTRENNETTPACWKTYWNCIAFELGTLCWFFFFLFFFLLCAVLFYFVFPLWWDNYRTTAEARSPGLEAEGRTPKVLRLKLYCIWIWRFFLIFLIFNLILFIYFFLIYLSFIFILFIFYFQSSVTLMPF